MFSKTKKRRSTSLFIHLLLCGVILTVTKASSYIAICSLQQHPTLLGINSVTNELSSKSFPHYGGKRQRRSLAGFFRGDTNTDSGPVGEYDPDEEIPAWACMCAPHFYCLSKSVNSCAIPSKIGEPIKCIHMSGVTMFARNIWFPLMVFYILMTVILLVTPYGRKALQYTFLFCFRHVNRRYAQQLSSDVEAYIKGNEFRRKELVLKTKIYQSNSLVIASSNDVRSSCGNDCGVDINSESSNSDVDDDDDQICSICIGEIEHGDIIGVISCKHMFHADCLKVWLKKNNVCPLCMRLDIATTRIREVNSQV